MEHFRSEGRGTVIDNGVKMVGVIGSRFGTIFLDLGLSDG